MMKKLCGMMHFSLTCLNKLMEKVRFLGVVRFVFITLKKLPYKIILLARTSSCKNCDGDRCSCCFPIISLNYSFI